MKKRKIGFVRGTRVGSFTLSLTSLGNESFDGQPRSSAQLNIFLDGGSLFDSACKYPKFLVVGRKCSPDDLPCVPASRSSSSGPENDF